MAEFNFNAETEEQKAQETPVVQTVDENGNIIGDSFTKEMSMQEGMATVQVLQQMDMGDKVEMNISNGKAVVTISNVTEDELSVINRKLHIATWSRLTIKVARKVTNFAADVADYTLNGAIAPTAVAVADAAITTGRVVGTAAVKAGAGVAASAFRNGRTAVTEVWNSTEIRDCGSEIKKCWSGISTKLFGASSTSGWTRRGA